MDRFTALVTSDYTRAAAAAGQLASPDTHCIVLAAEQHPAPAVVVVGGDGAALPSEVLQTTLRGLQLAAAQHLGHLHTTCSPPAHHLLTTCSPPGHHLAPWLTLMVKALVVAVLADPNTADSSLHWSLAWTYMW